MKRRIAAGVVAAATFALLAATAGCDVAPPGSYSDPGTPTPTPTWTTYAHPTAFDVPNAKLLKPVTGVSRGLLDGYFFYTVDEGAMIWGVDVRTGDPVVSASLAGYEGASQWLCWQQTTDAERVYAAAANYDADPEQPVPVQVVGVDKATSDVLWIYNPPTAVRPEATECGVSLGYTLTPTSVGLLLTVGQVIDDKPHEYSTMLDPVTGDVLWQNSTAVVAGRTGKYGVAVSPATHSSPSGYSMLQARLIDLATGELGAPMGLGATNGEQDADSFELAGMSGDNLVLLGRIATGDPVKMQAKTTIYQVSSATGEVAAKPVAVASTDLLACQMADADRLVCTLASDGTTAVGVSLKDGAITWQHRFVAAVDGEVAGTTQPLLFNGYLYGTDPAINQSFVLDTATGKVVTTATYLQPMAVNETGMVFAGISKGETILRCWWAPAVG